MALTTATITFDLETVLGGDFEPKGLKVDIYTNVPGGAIVDTDGNKIRLGSGAVTLNDDGTGTAAVWVPGAGSNPASWQTYIVVDYRDRLVHGGRTKRTFGPFTITSSANLADLVDEQEVPPTYISALTAELDTYATNAANSAAVAESAASLASAISGLDNADDAITLLDATPSSDYRVAQDARLSATYARVFGVPAPTGNAATDTANATATFNAAITAGKAVIQFQTGTYAINAALPTITKVGVSVTGASSSATTLTYTGPGACIKVLPTVFDVHQAGSISGLTINGAPNTNTGAGGIYYADVVGIGLHDVVVDYFDGNDQFGVWADIIAYWTERQTWTRVHINNCTHGWRIDTHAPIDTSHGWSRFLDVRINVSAQPPSGYAQTGVLVRNAAFLYNSTMFLTVNVAGTNGTDTQAPTVMHIETGKIKWCTGAIYAEISNGVNANGLIIGPTAGMVFNGTIEIPWSGNQPTTSTDMGLTGQIRLPGMIPTTGLASGGQTIVSPVGGTSQERVIARPNGAGGVAYVESFRPDNKTFLQYAKEGAVTKNLRETIFDATTTQVIERADRWSAPGSITRASMIQPLLAGPATAVAWGSANRAIFSRLDVPVRGTYRYVRFAIGVSSGNIQVGLVRLINGLADFEMVLNSGVIAAPAAGAKKIDLGATHLASGHYALFFWASNTTITVPWQGTNANEALGHAVVDGLASGVGATGSVSSWQSSARLGAFCLEADV